mgnify:FL=1
MTQPHDQNRLQYSDRDLLIAIFERVETLRTDVSDLKARMAIQEARSNKSDGFVSGGKFFWALVMSLPAGIGAYLFGVNK